MDPITPWIRVWFVCLFVCLFVCILGSSLFVLGVGGSVLLFWKQLSWAVFPAVIWWHTGTGNALVAVPIKLKAPSHSPITTLRWLACCSGHASCCHKDKVQNFTSCVIRWKCILYLKETPTYPILCHQSSVLSLPLMLGGMYQKPMLTYSYCNGLKQYTADTLMKIRLKRSI